MTGNRWRRIEEIFHGAVELAPKPRSVFLDRECGDDESLRKEVESLLANESEEGSTFVRFAGEPMPESIAHYRIVGKLGEGGMGDVYRASDTKLGREVAIKVLPAAFAGDPDRMARFQREAKVLASLNHPNIAAIYGVEDRALIMELVEGHDLRGPLPLSTALNYAAQIAGALDAAHEKGIVHRDLKPANIRITPDGVVKVLDFGLAKATSPGVGSEDSPTATGVTRAGTILGTAAYMAPEQARGHAVDKRADIWAFGVVLFEMLTGKRLFGAANVSDSLAAVLTREPVFDVLPGDTPPNVRHLLESCLRKDPKMRLRDIGDAAILLDQAQPQTAGSSRRWIPWAAAGVLCLVVLGVGLAWRRSTSAGFGKAAQQEGTTRFFLQLPEGATFTQYDKPVLSPDGKRIVFTARNKSGGLFVRSLDSLELQHWPGPEDIRFPFWSPDSRFVAFHSGGALKKVDLTGGPATVICDSPFPYGAAWNRDGVILFGSSAGLMRVNAAGGKLSPVTTVNNGKGERFHFWPSFLPDGDHFLFTISASTVERQGIYLGSLSSGQTSRILPDDSNAEYSSAGYLIFNRNGNLVAQPFDSTHLRLSGNPLSIADRVATLTSPVPMGAFSTAGGSLSYRVGTALSETQMEWRDRKGGRLGTVGLPADYSNPAISADGRILAVSKRDPAIKTRDIWLFDLVRGTNMRLTFDPADDTSPLWSPDGRRVVFTSLRTGLRSIWQKAASGAGQEEPLLQTDAQNSVEDWARDGRYLSFNRVFPGLETRMEVWALPLFGERKPFAVIAGQGEARESRFSPDGKWIAYVSDESGKNEVYVQNFPPAGGKWQISTDGGREPSWNPNGKELFYLHLNQLMAVDVKTGMDRFDPATPHLLFEAPFGNMLRNAYDVAPDGQKFLVNARFENTVSPSMAIVLNWPAAIK
jgi:serine/threonine protein kinase/Tol biopolymer transport system component